MEKNLNLAQHIHVAFLVGFLLANKNVTIVKALVSENQCVKFAQAKFNDIER